MNQIIEVIPREIGTSEVNSVDARELHTALGVKKKFADWISPKLKDTMLDEGVDYLVVNPQEGKNPKGGRPTTNYILTLDTAKHIAMMSRTAKGKEVRAYFIEVERQSTERKGDIPAPVLDVLGQLTTAMQSVGEGMQVMGRSLNTLSDNMEKMQSRVEALEGKATTTTNIHIMPPTRSQIEAKRTSIRLQMLKNLVEINPGINQSQLMGLAGYRRDDKSIRKLLKEMQGVLWEVLPYLNQYLYYPMEAE